MFVRYYFLRKWDLHEAHYRYYFTVIFLVNISEAFQLGFAIRYSNEFIPFLSSNFSMNSAFKNTADSSSNDDKSVLVVQAHVLQYVLQKRFISLILISNVSM